MSDSKRRPEAQRRNAVINLRLPEAVRALIDAAAASEGKTRTDFIVESSQRHATDVLLDKRLFALESRDYDAFVAALEAPPAPTAKLRALMRRAAPWDEPKR